MDLAIKFSDIEDAATRLHGTIHRTPIITSQRLDALSSFHSSEEKNVERHLFFKCEHLQKTGSFKVRGALNALLKLHQEQPDIRHVVTHSSGNHGQALAWAAAKKNFRCTVVVPEGTPEVKTRAIEGYGASLKWCAERPVVRETLCLQFSKEENIAFIHPFDHPDVIAGQGTVGLEMMEQLNELNIELDTIIIAVGGGSLAAGVVVAVKARLPHCKIIFVEPFGKELNSSLKSSTRMWSGEPRLLDTMAESIRRQQAGHLTFPIICQASDAMVVTISDEEMIQGMRAAASTLKQVVEAAAGASIAAALYGHLPFDAKNVGIILCGGNADIDKLPW